MLTKIFRYSIGVFFLTIGIILILSGKGFHFLFPFVELEIAQCRISATNEIIRIYEGNGGATTAFWYKVTYQENYFSTEKTILTTYGTPDYGLVNCQTNSIELIPIYSDEKPKYIQYELIRTSLVDEPIGIDWGKPADRLPNTPFGRIVKISLGAVISLVGLAVITFRRRISR